MQSLSFLLVVTMLSSLSIKRVLGNTSTSFVKRNRGRTRTKSIAAAFCSSSSSKILSPLPSSSWSLSSSFQSSRIIESPPVSIYPSINRSSSRLFATIQKQQSAGSSSQQNSDRNTNKNKKPAPKKKRIDTSTKNSNYYKNTGGLRELPVVRSSMELVDTAKRNVRNEVHPDLTVKNIKNRAIKHSTQTLNSITQSLCIPLRDIVKGYTHILNKKLHPFEKVVANLTAKSLQKQNAKLTLDVILDDINEGRKELLQAGKDWMYKSKNAENAKDANAIMNEGSAALYGLFDDLVAPSIKNIMTIQKSLRSAPQIQLNTPAVVLVGAPNVGKSTIVRKISSATPEVNNYPFTTRGMTLGHVEVFWKNSDTSSMVETPSNDGGATKNDDGQEQSKSPNRFSTSEIVANAKIPSSSTKISSRSTSKKEVADGKYAYSQLCQIMDSPGVLVREDEEHNEMELLTIAAMKHLPTAVMYVMDFSGNAGDKCSSIEDQLLLRKELRAKFPKRPWIDVVSKYDLGIVNIKSKSDSNDGEEGISPLDELDKILNNEDNSRPYIKLSIHENVGLSELRMEVMRMLGEVRVVLDAMEAAMQK